MTDRITLSMPLESEALAMVQEEIARLTAGAQDCQRRIMEHLERMRVFENWDWREDERLGQLELEHASWLRDRDGLVRQVVKLEMMKPKPRNFFKKWDDCPCVWTGEVAEPQAQRPEPFPNPEPTAYRPKV